MTSNNALQVNEGLQGDPPYLTRKDVKEDEDYAKIVAVLPSSLMGEAPPPLGLFEEWKQLGRAVRSFAFYIMENAECRPWGTLSAKTREKLLGIAPTTAKRFWDDDYDGDILIAAWIWRIITDDILCNPRRYDTPVWEAFGTLDAALSRRAGTLDGAIHPRPLSSLTTSNKNDEHGEVRDTSPLIDTLNPGTGTNNKNHEHDEARHISPLIGTLNPALARTTRTTSTARSATPALRMAPLTGFSAAMETWTPTFSSIGTTSGGPSPTACCAVTRQSRTLRPTASPAPLSRT